MKLLNIALSAGLLLGAVSCTKMEDEADYHGKISNPLGQRVHLKFFSTISDYEKDQNPVKTLTIEPNSALEVPQEFEAGTTYYLDWYSEDYRYTNWTRNGDNSFTVANIYPELDPVMTISSTRNPTRLLCLDGDQQSTTWIAYDAVNWSSSVWSSLMEHRKFHKFVFRRDFTGTYYSIETPGDTSEIHFTYFANFNSWATPQNTVINMEFPQLGLFPSLTNQSGIYPIYSETDTLRTNNSFIGSEGYTYYFKKI